MNWIPLLLVLLTGSDWERDFKRGWNSGEPQQQRSAIRSLKGINRPEVVRTLIWATSRVERKIGILEREQRHIQSTMARIPADSLVDPEGRLIDREGFEKRKELDRESKRVQKERAHYISLYEEYEVVISAFTDPETISLVCAETRRSRYWRFRYAAIRGMSGLDADGVQMAFEDGLEDREGRVAVAAAEVLASWPESLSQLGEALHRPEWQVQLAAAKSLESLDRVEAIEYLLTALEESDGRMKSEFNSILVALTGQNKHEKEDLWREWWTEVKEGFDETRPSRAERLKKAHSARKGADGQSTFYGIQVRSKRMIFVLDRSGSMGGPARMKVGGGMATAGAGDDSEIGDRKIDVCRYELKRVLRSLPDDARFSIIYYNRDGIRFPKKGLARATTSTVKKACRFLDAIDPLGATNIFDMLEEGMSGKWEDQVDTLFLLSDGLPNCGRVETPGEIAKEIQRLNSDARVRIHTINVGGGSANRQFMKRLAEENDGTFVDRSGS